VERVASLVEHTWTMPVGTPVRYSFATSAGTVERTVPVMRFTLADYVALFGVWLVNGLLFIVLGFAVAYLKPGRPASIAMFVFSSAWGLTLILSLGDFYRFDFRSLYALMQAIPPAAMIVLGLTFPDRPLPRRAGALLAGLGVLTLAETVLDVVLYDRAPRLWMTFFEASFVYMAARAPMGCALLLVWDRRARAARPARERRRPGAHPAGRDGRAHRLRHPGAGAPLGASGRGVGTGQSAAHQHHALPDRGRLRDSQARSPRPRSAPHAQRLLRGPHRR